MFFIKNKFKKSTSMYVSATLSLVGLIFIPNMSFASCGRTMETGLWQNMDGNITSPKRVKVEHKPCSGENPNVTTWYGLDGALYKLGILSSEFKMIGDRSWWIYSRLWNGVDQWLKWDLISNKEYLRVWTYHPSLDIKPSWTTDYWFVKTISQPGKNSFGWQLSEFRNNQAGRCLDGDLASINRDGGVVQSWGCWNSRNQNWYIKDDGSIVNYQSGKCLDADLGTINQDGTKVQLWSCWGGLNQKWIRNANGTITNAQSGRCLDVDLGNINKDGSKVQLWSCWGGKNQLWEGEYY
jgi:hypothetical protein